MEASRIDRIYTTKELSDKKVIVETVAAAFTDHLFVVMWLNLDDFIVRRCKGVWKINISILSEEAFLESLRQMWAVLRQQRKFYPRLAHVVGKVRKNRFVFSLFRKVPNLGGTLSSWRISSTSAFMTFCGTPTYTHRR